MPQRETRQASIKGKGGSHSHFFQEILRKIWLWVAGKKWGEEEQKHLEAGWSPLTTSTCSAKWVSAYRSSAGSEEEGGGSQGPGSPGGRDDANAASPQMPITRSRSHPHRAGEVGHIPMPVLGPRMKSTFWFHLVQIRFNACASYKGRHSES